MRRRVTTAPVAALALAEARIWLTQPGAGPAAAKRWISLKTAPRTLRDHPYAGTPSQDHPSVRQMVVSGYRLIYAITPDTGDAATTGDIEIYAVLPPGAE